MTPTELRARFCKVSRVNSHLIHKGDVFRVSEQLERRGSGTCGNAEARLQCVYTLRLFLKGCGKILNSGIQQPGRIDDCIILIGRD